MYYNMVINSWVFYIIPNNKDLFLTSLLSNQWSQSEGKRKKELRRGPELLMGCLTTTLRQ